MNPSASRRLLFFAAVALISCAAVYGAVAQQAEQPSTEEAVADEAQQPASPTAEAQQQPASPSAAIVAAEAEKKAVGKVLTGEELYKKLLVLARGENKNFQLFDKLITASRHVDWAEAEADEFLGNIRRLEIPGAKSSDDFYMVRKTDGDIFILAVPADQAQLAKGSGTPYSGLGGKLQYKLKFEGRVVTSTVDGYEYKFLQLVVPPERLFLDRLFFIAIVLLLFLTMVGMGLTLTLTDFGLVFKKPAGMIIGPVLQFMLLPFIAMILGRAAGFYETYPFIFLGLILVASSPGGVTSNLMTYLGKGDVALSVSLTALCTVLSIVLTPLVITAYVANIPYFNFPVVEVIKTMLVLVIVPLFVGMLVRGKWEKTAKKLEKPFALLGVFALLFLIIVGVWSNLDKFADTQRYGFKFYSIIFLLTFLGMLSATLVSKIFRINNYQTRAISLEVGLRNASLAMTIAILLQDTIGDFSSSMFFSSGIFGLWMYVAGAITIFLFPKMLPIDEAAIEAEKAGDMDAAAEDRY